MFGLNVNMVLTFYLMGQFDLRVFNLAKLVVVRSDD